MNVGIMVIEVRDGLVENVEDDREVIDDEPILIWKRKYRNITLYNQEKPGLHCVETN